MIQVALRSKAFVKLYKSVAFRHTLRTTPTHCWNSSLALRILLLFGCLRDLKRYASYSSTKRSNIYWHFAWIFNSMLFSLRLPRLELRLLMLTPSLPSYLRSVSSWRFPTARRYTSSLSTRSTIICCSCARPSPSSFHVRNTYLVLHYIKRLVHTIYFFATYWLKPACYM